MVLRLRFDVGCPIYSVATAQLRLQPWLRTPQLVSNTDFFKLLIESSSLKVRYRGSALKLSNRIDRSRIWVVVYQLLSGIKVPITSLKRQDLAPTVNVADAYGERLVERYVGKN